MSEYVAKTTEENKSVIPFTPSQPITDVIPFTPSQPIADEIITLVTRISEAFLSNSIYPPGFFERIPSLSKQFVVSVNFYVIILVDFD